LRFSRFPVELEFEAPLLGEHNEAVLTRYLAYTPVRIKQLVSEGVLYSEPN
jgi:crotonobetainyl-CoA:carnitine CoA-transferase CaiB-like acyl-CoA transferase